MIKCLENWLKKKTENPVSNEAKVNVKDASQRLTDELKTLMTKNKDLYDLIFDLAEYLKETYKKELIITMIDRTQAEQDEIYKDDKKYKEKPFKSPHQFWQAVDIRSKIYTPEEIKAIEKYLNDKYNATNYYAWTARNHKVGAGSEHFHIQYFKQVKKT